MSSLRNAIYRRAHKERAQPQSRKKFGLLEKHKDYVVRARAFHKKEQYIQKLKEKAAFRNPDEFYFKMIHSKTVDGVHRQEKTVASYRELEARKGRVIELRETIHGHVIETRITEKGKKRKLREDEIVCPTSKPVYKWRPERKR